MADLGKKWETKFADTFEKQFPNRLIYRLPDQQSGYAGTGGSNPCDFLCYPGNCVLMVECKAHAGSSISFSAIRQYEKMLSYKDTYKTYIGVLVWFYEKDKIIWVSIEEMEKMVNDGEKSIGLRMLKENYPKKYCIIDVQAKKLRTFMEPDLRWLCEQITGPYLHDGRNYINDEGHFVHVDYMIGGLTLADMMAGGVEEANEDPHTLNCSHIQKLIDENGNWRDPNEEK